LAISAALSDFLTISAYLTTVDLVVVVRVKHGKALSGLRIVFKEDLHIFQNEVVPAQGSVVNKSIMFRTWSSAGDHEATPVQQCDVMLQMGMVGHLCGSWKGMKKKKGRSWSGIGILHFFAHQLSLYCTGTTGHELKCRRTPSQYSAAQAPLGSWIHVTEHYRTSPTKSTTDTTGQLDVYHRTLQNVNRIEH